MRSIQAILEGARTVGHAQDKTRQMSRGKHGLRFHVPALLLLLGFGLAHGESEVRSSGFVYNAAGLIAKEIVEPTNSNLCLVTTYVYDDYGNKTESTTRNCNGGEGEALAPTGDPVIEARITPIKYDAKGQFIESRKNALGHEEKLVTDARFGVVTQLTGPNKLVTRWEYDGFGRKTKEIRADGTYTELSYQFCTGIWSGNDACPSVDGVAATWFIISTPRNSSNDQIGAISRAYYDRLNREIRNETQGFDGRFIRKDTRYDELGRVAQTSRPYYEGAEIFWQSVEYDRLSRVVKSIGADLKETRTIYDGLTITTVNAKNQSRIVRKNSQGQIVALTEQGGFITRYAYDPFGNLTLTKDNDGNQVVLAYDRRGRKIQMNDPDMGIWQYRYDALGQLIRQTDAKNQVTTIAYDKLGRTTQRNEPDLKSSWTYDTCLRGLGKLCQADTDTGYSRVQEYDTKGRPSKTSTTHGKGTATPVTYISQISYNANGQVETRTDPGGVVLKYLYTAATGYLRQVRDGTSNGVYWTANSISAEGQLLQQTYGNNIITNQSFNRKTGRITQILAGTGSNILNLNYDYDDIGNMLSRGDVNQNLTESFDYDNLNRLYTATLNANAVLSVTNYRYDAIGNITWRGDVGEYRYNPAGRPHAVGQIDLNSGARRGFGYDGNGNLMRESFYAADGSEVPSKGRDQYYTSFNMPMSIGAFGYSSAFAYGPEHQRIQQVSSAASGTTIYINPDNEGGLMYEKDLRADGGIEQRSYITAGGSVIGMVRQVTISGATNRSIIYFHRDNLGSTAAVTNGAGNLLERFAYEPFGKWRKPEGPSDPDNLIDGVYTDRGFTNHEHMSELGLIHMNGRIYDPRIGRFTSPDPLIQAPYFGQSYNRYSYVLNNPLGGADPSGYSWLSDTWHKVWHSTVGRIAVTVAVAYFTGYYDWGTGGGIFGSAGGGFANGFAGGFAGGLVGSGGDLKAGLYGGITGAAFGWLGGQGLTGFEAVMAHAGVGCVTSAMQGGKCGSGALAAGFGKFASLNMPEFALDNDIFELTYVSVVGGTASVLGGDKFANGAITASFAYLFNGKTTGRALALKGAQGLAMMTAEIGAQGFQLVASEVYFLSDSGVVTRIDGVYMNAKGEVLFGEAKMGDYADLTKNQKAAFSELSEGKGTFYGQQGRLVAEKLSIQVDGYGRFSIPSQKVLGCYVCTYQRATPPTTYMQEINRATRSRGGYAPKGVED